MDAPDLTAWAPAVEPLDVLSQLDERIHRAEKAELALERDLRAVRSHLTQLRKARGVLSTLPPDVLAILGGPVLDDATDQGGEIDEAEGEQDEQCGPDISTWTKIKVTAEDILTLMRNDPYATWSGTKIQELIPESSAAQIRRQLRGMAERKLIQPTTYRGRFTLAPPLITTENNTTASQIA